jgi:hypothetical protein
VLARAIGERGFDAGQIRGWNIVSVPGKFLPEVSEGGTGLLVGSSHLGVAVVEHDEDGRWRITHADGLRKAERIVSRTSS